ncbi:hypothetical protein JOF53_000935 [Crossiella equi]|uniref:SMI1/KNR4 family protein n=1 Tax=Crossiella equi TaxID=130796 RepID=A0ABS5A629_9PSEU|nr:hypothetical protein [Crossiella equi]MBP2472063.1 hypothetical protein [Crossiella equi]
MPSLLATIAAHPEVTRFLAWPGDFELDRADHVEEVHLLSGARLEGFAGDGSGGTFFFCGEGGEERPVLYADSEGGAAVLAANLPELLRLLLVAPWWRDGHEASAEYLADLPDFADRRDQAAAVLGLDLPDEHAVLTRLHEIATTAGPEFTLVLTSEGTAYDPLFTA